jgi:uncharacterized protein with HEPN domain
MKGDDDRIADMLDAAESARAFAEGRKREDLEDDLLYSALVMKIILLGEAASRISEPTRARLPDIPWRELGGMRNRMVHAYWSVDPDELWVTVERDIPVLIQQLNALDRG